MTSPTAATRHRAYELLGELLATPGMPALAWTISPDGDALTGEVVDGDDARRIDAFHAWVAHLSAYIGPRHKLGGRVTRLSAVAARAGVEIVIRAALYSA